MNNKTYDQIIQEMLKSRKVRISISKESHFLFSSAYLNEYVKYKTADFQKEMFTVTEDEEIKKAIIVSFRGSAKSTLMTLSYPLWAILGKQQKKFILILSQTQQQAKLHLANIRREFENNAMLRQEFGPFEERTNEWGANSIVIPKFDAKIMVASSEQSIRGIRHGSRRPDLIICDDVEDLNSVKTKEGRDKTYDWFSSEVLPLGDKDTKIIVVGNLLHEDSLLMRLKEKIIKGETDGFYKEYPLVDETGQILWPGKFPSMKDVEEERKKIGNENAWEREFMLRIIPDDGQVIKPGWLKFYDEFPDGEPNFIITGIDLAISTKNTADYTAMVSACVYGAGRNQKAYILPNPINKRLDFPETLEKVEQLYKSLNAIGSSKIYIEEVGYQAASIQQLRSRGIPAEGFKPHGSDKRSRLASTGNLIFSGQILFPKEGAEELIQQLVGFGKEKYDDLADAFSILGLKLIERERNMGGFLITGVPVPDFLKEE